MKAEMNMNEPDTKLAEIQARVDKATPGEWRADGPHKNQREKGEEHFSIFWPDCGNGAHVFREQDAVFIAHAPADLRFCLQTIAELRAKIESHENVS